MIKRRYALPPTSLSRFSRRPSTYLVETPTLLQPRLAIVSADFSFVLFFSFFPLLIFISFRLTSIPTLLTASKADPFGLCTSIHSTLDTTCRYQLIRRLETSLISQSTPSYPIISRQPFNLALSTPQCRHISKSLYCTAC